MPAKGLLVRLPTGCLLGEDLIGGRDTLGERVILERGRRRCSCAIDLWGCHGRMKNCDDDDDDDDDDDCRRALC